MNRKPYQELAKVKLAGFPDYINFKQVIATKVAQATSNPPSFRNAIGGIYLYFMESLFSTTEYNKVITEKSKYLLFYGAYNCRKDHLRTFRNFSERFLDADSVYASPCEKKYHFFLFLKSIWFFFLWMFQMLTKGLPLFEVLNAIRFVGICYKQKALLHSLVGKHYHFVVVYYDASPDENYLVQLFNHANITTMTLQHGIFSRKSTIRTISDTAFELSESISDYYLAWNHYTKDEAIKVGLKEDRIIVLGAPKYINYKEPEKPCFANNNVFGVILNNSSFDTHNRHLIEAANNIYNELGYSFILRYHPEMKGNEYDNLCGKGFLKKDDNGHTIAEYASEVSFTIISSSSVLVDLLLLKHPTYRLKVFDEDTYSTVEYNSFKTVNELKLILEKGSTENSAFDYLCNSYDTYNNYRSFFDTMLNRN